MQIIEDTAKGMVVLVCGCACAFLEPAEWLLRASWAAITGRSAGALVVPRLIDELLDKLA